MNIILHIFGFLLGFSIPFIYSYFKDKINSKKEPKFLRRGIFTSICTLTRNLEKSDITIQYELGEVERTKDKSKVNVINFTVINSTEAKDMDNKIKALIENSWILSTEIEWIEDDITTQRDKKLQEILK